MPEQSQRAELAPPSTFDTIPEEGWLLERAQNMICAQNHLGHIGFYYMHINIKQRCVVLDIGAENLQMKWYDVR